MPRPGLFIITAFIASQSPMLSAADSDTVGFWKKLHWLEKQQLPESKANALPSFCRGDYVAPPSIEKKTGVLEIESDSGEYSESGVAQFSGHVAMKRDGNQVKGESAIYDPQSGEVVFQQDIQFISPDISMLAERLDYNTETGAALLQGSYYTIPRSHIRGQADNIELAEDQSLTLINASYTYCEPGSDLWDLKSTELFLNEPEGYGEAYHARLRIKQVPILYLPYYRFPISEDRLTGFLNPEISIGARSAKGDISDTDVFINELALPFYFNIAPNYDDTFTPRYVRDHGVMLENQFRYLNGLGLGQMDVSYLGDDESNNLAETETGYREDAERWSRAWQHKLQLSQSWQYRINYQEVSDVYFDNDFSRSGVINRDSYLKQNTELEFNNGDIQFLTRAEQYQTIDENISDASKPYYRLPQLRVSNLNIAQDNQLHWHYEAEATSFSRDNDDLSGINSIEGQRIHGQLDISYPWRNSYSFIEPQISMMSTFYELSNIDDDLQAQGFDTDQSRQLYSAQIDAGLFFERQLTWFDSSFIQTLEPRVMLAYTPYEEQQYIPLFDTTATSFSYSQLFSADRFTGYDRIGDTQQISLGLTTRFLNDTGSEVFRASVGQIHYLQDRRIALTTGSELTSDTQNDSSSLAGELAWTFSEYWRTNLDVQYDVNADKDEEPFEKASWQLNYQNPDSWLFDMNFSHVEASKQKQVGLAFFVPLSDAFAFYGQRKQDIYPYDSVTKEEKEADNLLNIESLVGVEYQNCCMRFQFTYEEHTQSDNQKDYQFLFQIHFKGLGILGSKSEEILSERIYGYDQRQIHDY